MFTAKLIATFLGVGLIWLIFREKRNPLWEKEADNACLFDMEEEGETDIDCSQETLSNVLKDLPNLLEKGFTVKESETLLNRSLLTKINDQFDVSYNIPWKNGINTLRVTVFRDDIDSIILYFRGPISLIEQIEERLDPFIADE